MAWGTSSAPRCSKSSTRSSAISGLVVVAGPSGVGKTSLAKGVVARRPDVYLSISATTRAPRPGERDGEDYRFLSPDEFARLESDGAFLETATVHGSARYGTLRAPVDEALTRGRAVLLEIDVQGARQVKRARAEALLVFVRPPTWEVLEARLRSRGSEGEEAIERRLATAKAELTAAPEFDVVLVNDDLEVAVGRLIRILDEAHGPRPEASPTREQELS